MTQRRLPARLEPIGPIAAGGFLGALARYGVGIAAPGLVGTFVVNVTGSAALGAVFYFASRTGRVPNRLRLFVATGFLSSYTTYSTFAVETMGVPPIVGLANVLGSYACGFAAVLLGRRLVLGRWR